MIILGGILIFQGIIELQGGLAGESRPQWCRRDSVAIAILDPWQRIGGGVMMSVLGLALIAIDLRKYWKCKDKDR
jgi:hypothetical protein